MQALTILAFSCCIIFSSAHESHSDEPEATSEQPENQWSFKFSRVTTTEQPETADTQTTGQPAADQHTTVQPPTADSTTEQPQTTDAHTTGQPAGNNLTTAQSAIDDLPTTDEPLPPVAFGERPLGIVPTFLVDTTVQPPTADSPTTGQPSSADHPGDALRIVQDLPPEATTQAHKHIRNRTGQFTLTILHTNDVHARFISFNDQGRPCTPKNLEQNICWGGAARRQTAMKKFKAEDENVLKLDAGDQFQGTLWYTALKWQPIAQYMNILNYDVMAFGNHEFDDGMEGLEPFVRNLTTPIVNSNIEDAGSPIKDLYHRKIIKEVGGQKIGIVGCTTTEVPNVAKPGPMLQFIDEVVALQPIVDQLKAEGVNKIIVLSHAGIKKERQICQHVRGVDVVVGGHSHTFLWSGPRPSLEAPEGPYPEVYGNDDGNHTCLVVQDFAYGKYLGRLKVYFDLEGHVVDWEGNPVPLDARTFPEDPEIARLLSPYQAQLAHFQKTIVADTAVKLDGNRRSCRVRECNLGNLLADAALYFYVRRQFEENQLNSSLGKGWTPASIALWNSGGVRDYEAVPGGNITLEDLYTIMPFGNTIDKVTVKGIVLKEAFEHAVAKYVETIDDPEGRFLQVSGIKVIYDLSKPPGQRVKSLKIRCNKCGVPSFHPVDLEELYDVVTHTYVSSGGDGYTMLRDKKVGSDGSNMLDVDVVMDYVKSYKPLLTGEELRIEWDQGNGQVDRIPRELAEFNAGR